MVHKLSKAPFTYFGGKSMIASQVWQRLGNTPNYVEPFFGSGAMLLQRPHWDWNKLNWHNSQVPIETVNDIDGMVANAWRAIQYAPEETAHYADWPALENDLHARHLWLVNQKPSLQEKLEGDPAYYDAKAAGWWIWGMSQWIGGEFCSGKGPWKSVNGEITYTKGFAGQGVRRRRIHLSSDNLGAQSKNKNLYAWFEALSARLRFVRVVCGDWNRICGPTPTFLIGTTAVFLDPPYPADANRNSTLYTHESTDVGHAVQAWAIENGNNPLMRIAICGYDSLVMPDDWTLFCWKTHGGYAHLGNKQGLINRHREVIWFSPHCIKVQMASLWE